MKVPNKMKLLNVFVLSLALLGRNLHAFCVFPADILFYYSSGFQHLLIGDALNCPALH